MSRRWLVMFLVVLATCAVRPWPATQGQENGAIKRKVVKTEAEWRKLLTPPQFEVTRNKATEPAFSGKYAVSHAKGIYECVCCSAPLFSSQAKFDSGTGWPSFWQPINAQKIQNAPDYHGSEPRVEVMCMDCGAHLGHVFDDGPPPTGLRYCINSLSLKLVPATAAATAKKGSSKTKKSLTPSTDSPPAEKSDAPAPPAEKEKTDK